MTDTRKNFLVRHWLKLALALPAAALLVAFAWQQLQAPSPVNTTRQRTNDKVLIAGGWSAGELEKILADFRDAYRQQLRPDFSYEIESGGGVQKARFPHDIQPWLFVYLVNYAQYPKHFAIEGRTIRMAATSTLTPDFDLPSQSLYGRKALFYVPASDVTFDRLYVQAGDAAFEINLDDGTWLQVKDARRPAELDSLAGAPVPPS